jgi:hypothetical protein
MNDVKISIASYQTRSRSNSVTVSDLTQDEAEQLLGAVKGVSWFKVESGRLLTSPVHLPLPDPIHDETMFPFWREFSNTQSQREIVPKIFDEMSGDVIYSPHFTIQSLCGYDYTPDNYTREAEKLVSYGFIQVRSQRNQDGGYWELWYLPGIWCAKGDLKAVVDKITNLGKSWEDSQGRRKEKMCFEAVLDHLRKNISFGTLDVSIQRLCMVMDD